MASRKTWLGVLAMSALLLAMATGLAAAQEPQPAGQEPQAPLGNAITYQGQLVFGVNPVNDRCDFIFTLYPALTGGTQIGTQTRLNIPVSNGLFTFTDLDFGSSAFSGEARWMDIQVRCPAGTGAYTRLGPRQAVTAVPYGLYSKRAPWTGLASVPAGFADNIDNDVLGGLSCANGQIAKWNGSAWVCAADQSGGGGGWSLTGNAGTTPGTNFVGTTDNQALEFKVNGLRALRLVPKNVSPNVIAGYEGNTVAATAVGAAIGGGGAAGTVNQVTDSWGTVSGGQDNQAGNGDGDTSNKSHASVGGGLSNKALGDATTIGGGRENRIDPNVTTSVIGGGYRNVITSTTSTEYVTIGGGWSNQASGPSATVGGGAQNNVTGPYATIGGGVGNKSCCWGATVGGGTSNTTSNSEATVAGGSTNMASGEYSAIGGGSFNQASGNAATIAGGAVNVASAIHAVVGGGTENTASGRYATVAGGSTNTANNTAAVVAGGAANTAGELCTVGGGSGNTARDYIDTIAGGAMNTATGGSSSIGGGYTNRTEGAFSTVSGGSNNQAVEEGSTVGGGTYNRSLHAGATVNGGRNNTATGFATVGGGLDNRAGGFYDTVGGGKNNYSSGESATIAGGIDNQAAGYASAVAGGEGNSAESAWSFVAGRRAHAGYNKPGCFVWGDSTNAEILCNDTNRWVARASGGVYFYTHPSLASGVYVPAGSGTWYSVSDRAKKDNLRPVDSQAVLATLAHVPISTWNYTTQDPGIVHMGPTAQDFYAAFGLGEDPTHLSSIDPDGVALAAIQGLYERSQAQAARIDTLEAENASLRASLADQQRAIDSLAEEVALLDRAVRRAASPLGKASPWSLAGLAGLFIGGLWLSRRRHPGGGL